MGEWAHLTCSDMTAARFFLIDRWFIFKEQGTLGPYAAEEVRMFLREGTIDPFDMVAREGSNVRRELIDVDEIFEQQSPQFSVPSTTEVVAKAKPPLAGAQGNVAASGFVPSFVDQTTSRGNAEGVPHRSASGPLVGNRQLFLADAQAETERPASRERDSGSRPRARNPRYFQLVDEQGRMQGPLSATDILRLYYKGVLGKGIVVLRQNSKARIPVARFVAAMSREQTGESGLNVLPGRGHHPTMGQKGGGTGGGKDRRGLAGRAEARQASWLATGLLVLAMFFGVVAAWLVIGAHGQAPQRERRLDASTGSQDTKERVESSRAARAARSSASPEASRVEREPRILPIQPSNVPQMNRTPETTRPSKASSQMSAASRDGGKQEPNRAPKGFRSRDLRTENMKERRSLAAKPKAPPFRLIQSPVRSPAPVAPARRSVEPALTRSPRQLPVKKTPVAMVPPPAGTTASPIPSTQLARSAQPARSPGATLVDGQTVTAMGPYSFERAEVARCKAACTVTFRGPTGAITGAFFKSVWGPILMEKRGPVRLSGLVRKVGATIKIIVSDIQ